MRTGRIALAVTLVALPAVPAAGDQLMELGDTAEVRRRFRRAEIDSGDRHYAERSHR
jgi:hypothetical protein